MYRYVITWSIFCLFCFCFVFLSRISFMLISVLYTSTSHRHKLSLLLTRKAFICHIYSLVSILFPYIHVNQYIFIYIYICVCVCMLCEKYTHMQICSYVQRHPFSTIIFSWDNVSTLHVLCTAVYKMHFFLIVCMFQNQIYTWWWVMWMDEMRRVAPSRRRVASQWMLVYCMRRQYMELSFYGDLYRICCIYVRWVMFYAVNWCVSRWNGRDTMDVINFFISRPGGLTHEKV